MQNKQKFSQCDRCLAFSMIVAGTNILAIFLMLTTKHKKTRVPMWLKPEATLAEIEPLVANRLLCFRRRFWFSDIDLEQADRAAFHILASPRDLLKINNH